MARKREVEEAAPAAPEVPPSDTNGKKAPLQSFYYPVVGGTLCVSIWPKTISTEDGDKVLYSATVQRSYLDEEQTRKWGNSLRDTDLPVAAIALQDCYRHILSLRQKGEAVPF